MIIVPFPQVLQLLLPQLLGKAVAHHGVQDLQFDFMLCPLAELLVGLLQLALVVVDTYLC